LTGLSASSVNAVEVVAHDHGGVEDQEEKDLADQEHTKHPRSDADVEVGNH
jgi:hypothetical protein